MTCPSREDLVAVLDGALSPDALAAARAHADGCARCRAELAHLDAGVALLRAGAPAPEPSPFFATRLAARLAAEPAPPRRRGLAGLFAATPWRLAAAGGLAAALVAGAGAGISTVQRAHRARAAEELAVAERLELLEDLEVVASVDAVESADDVAVIAALDDGAGPREGRP
jgi:anti-sigma factor RsiW